jgi:serine/threonine protein kinase
MVQAAAEATLPSSSASGVPERIGKYEIIRDLGQGSSGRVYLSHDPYYGRDVAIKVYNLESEEDEKKAKVTRKMFFNEAQMMGRLQHPNILPIYDAGEEENSYYVVTEPIHGARTLAAYCRPDNLLRIDDVVEIIFKCAKALHYAHSRGVVHRDVKPGNIMLTLDNDVRIIDFGIALVADSDVSRIEGIAGSPSYMSPEQVQSEEITAKSDIYSLGVVMYELLTGFRPFRANSLSKLLHQIIYATPEPIHSLRAEISETLEHVTAVALQKDPEQRYPTGTESSICCAGFDSSTTFLIRKSGKCCAPAIGATTRARRRFFGKANSMIASISSLTVPWQLHRVGGKLDCWGQAIVLARPATSTAPGGRPRSLRRRKSRWSGSVRRC